jgi:hypothetical protein
MTNEIKTQKQARIEDLKAKLIPMYNLQEENVKKYTKELVDKTTTLVNPTFPIGVSIHMEGIEFYTIHEATQKGVNPPYPDSSSRVSITNRYSWMRLDRMDDVFNTELDCSGMRINFGVDVVDVDITKIQLMSFLSTEFIKYQTANVGSSFIRHIRELFIKIRSELKAISEIQYEVSSLQSDLDKFKKEEERVVFDESFKEDNWYQSPYNSLHVNTGRRNQNAHYEVYYHIKKLSPKTATIDVYSVSTQGYIDTKRVPLEEIYKILKNRTLLTESPMKKEIA